MSCVLQVLEGGLPQRVELVSRELGNVGEMLTTLATHPTNDVLLVGTTTGKLLLWDGSRQSASHTIQAHQRDVTEIAFSADGSKCVSASMDGSLQWWDDKLQPQAAGSTGCPINSVSISPDGRFVVAACEDTKVRVFDQAEGKCTAVMTGHPDPVTACLWLADKSIVTGGATGWVIAWDLDGRRVLRQQKGHSQRVSHIVAARGRGWYASGGWDGLVKVWSATHREKFSFPKAEKSVTGVTIAADDTVLVASFWDGVVRFWNTESGRAIDDFNAHEGALAASSLMAGGHQLVTADQDGVLRSWNTTDVGKFNFVNRHSAETYAVHYTPDNLELLSAGQDGYLKVWGRDDRSEKLAMQAHEDAVTAVAIAPDAAHWALGCGTGEIKIWDVISQSFEATLTGHRGPISCLRYTPRGDQIVSGSWDMKLKLWSTKTNRLECNFDGHTKEVSGCDVSLDGRKMVSSSWDGTIGLWDLLDRRRDVGKLLRLCDGHVGRVLCCAFSPDGSNIASGGADQTVRLWKVKDLSEPKVLHGHRNEVTACRFTPDGQMLLTADRSGEIKAWDAITGEPLADAQWGRPVLTLAIAPDGLQVAVGDAEGGVGFIDLVYSPTPMWLACSTTIKKASLFMLGTPPMEAYEATCLYCGNTEAAKSKQLGNLWRCPKCSAAFMLCPVGLPPSDD